ncbi:MAG: TRAP transporter large permease subunit [Burkholderiales bacterium]|nr:TRAP transporter large permease subunit [Burkholderiales bacterium]
MPLNELMAILMFVSVIFVIMLGFPVAFTMSGVAIIFALIGSALDVFEWRTMGAIMGRIYGIMSNEMLVAITLFVLMGILLEKSRAAERLVTTTSKLFGSFSGGLAFSVVIVGAMLAAATGMVAATVSVLALITVPAMRRAGYQPSFMSGTICATGTLAQLIPPSTVLILIGDMLRGATPADRLGGPVTVSDLFAGAILPGLVVVGLFMLYILYRAVWYPQTCPPLLKDTESKVTLKTLFVDAIVPLSLIVAVLGSILGGIATPTEAAAVGAVGSAVIVVLDRGLSWRMVSDVSIATGYLVTMVYALMIGATIFSLAFKGFGGDQVAFDLLAKMPGNAMGALFIVLALTFVLGFFLDSFEIIFIVVPTFAPPLIALGIEPLWFGVLLAVVLQTSYLTPPFGLAVFYLMGVYKDIGTSTIIRGVIPYTGLQCVAIAAIFYFPWLSTWLPTVLF